jgi:predicted nucleic-acid-binding protein
LDKLLSSREIVVEQSEIVRESLNLYRNTRADFADCLIAASAKAAGCSRTVTFDRIAARDAGMELVG